MAKSDDSMLPTWNGPRNGSGCDNPDCEASDRHVRVLSREEVDRVYPRKENLPFWPLPNQATHVCDRCGFIYDAYVDGYSFTHASSSQEYPDLPMDEWDWDEEMAFDRSVRDAALRFIEGAPDGLRADEIADGVARSVPGADRDLAYDLLDEHDEFDVVVHPADTFM